MRFQIWNSAFNVLMMVFWFRLWNRDDRALFFNPHLSALDRLSDFIIGFMRPLFAGTPPRAIPAILIMFLLVLRALMIALGAPLTLRLGFEAAQPVASDILSCVVFSVLSFAVFLFMLWGLSLLYVRTRFSSSSHHTLNAVHSLALPFSGMRAEFRPPILLALGIVLAAALKALGAYEPFPDVSYTALFLHLTISALAGWTNVLAIVHSFTILLIIGSWVAMFTNSLPMVRFCNEWLSFLMGPLRRYPLVIGMFNLTPLIFMFAIGFIHRALIGLLGHAYISAA